MKIPILNWIKSRLTMSYKKVLFRDVVNGKDVCLYVDCFGVEWMAQSKFGFRMKRD